MDFRPNISDLKTPEDVIRLVSALSEVAEALDVLYTETAPNGNISARIGRIAIYKNGSNYEQWQNTDGATTWQRIDQGPFKSGDWIVSTVTTAHPGWTNVSATYANKFIRINATPLTTGGSDTHTHGAGSYTMPAHSHGGVTGSHTLTTSEMPAHTHDITVSIASGAASSNFVGKGNNSSPETVVGAALTTGGGQGHTHTVSQEVATTITGTSAAGDNVPAYVQTTIFQKD